MAAGQLIERKLRNTCNAIWIDLASEPDDDERLRGTIELGRAHGSHPELENIEKHPAFAAGDGAYSSFFFFCRKWEDHPVSTVAFYHPATVVCLLCVGVVPPAAFRLMSYAVHALWWSMVTVMPTATAAGSVREPEIENSWRW